MPETLIVERDVPTPMRDGVILRADVYRRSGADHLPVLLQRTPYGKAYTQNGFALAAAERGYAVVIQDTRGRWSSGGEGYPFIHEKSDGYDTVQWAAGMGWSDGQVGMFGGSYCGYTQYAAASMHPPALKTIVPIVTFLEPRSTAYQGGANHLGIPVAWNLLVWSLPAILRLPPPEQPPMIAQLIRSVDGLSTGETLKTLPLNRLPLIGKGEITPYFAEFLEIGPDGELWNEIACAPADITIPAFHIGGWYDMFIATTISDFNAIREQGNPHQKLLIGPWTHSMFDNAVGEADFGLQTQGDWLLPDELQLRWFDYWLKGIQNGIMDEPRVRIFVMGINQWRNENEWPPARSQDIAYSLHSSGAANSLHGDGTLTSQAPGAEPADTFDYDPLNPVPTCGGALLGWKAALREGVYDQRWVEERLDMLVYTSEPLEAELEVSGTVHVNFWASTSAASTDFTAKLVDVRPSGYAANLADSIVRLTAPNSTGSPDTINMHEISIQLGPTCHVFLPGHRIRLEISSSNFPRFDRNLNTGLPSASSDQMAVARQTIYHDRDHPATLILPVIRKDG